jgi:hypothetical protein
MFSFFEAHKARFHSALTIPLIKTLAESKTFLFQAAKDRFDEFLEIRVGSEAINGLLNMVRPKSGFKFDVALNSSEAGSDEYNLLRLIGHVMSYFGSPSPMWREFNARSEKPYIIGTVMPVCLPAIWTKYLLKTKLGEEVNSFGAPGIRNSILYLRDPKNNISTMSEDWRKHILGVVFGNNRDAGVGALIDGMRSIGIEAAHPFNSGRLCDEVLRTLPEIMEWDRQRNGK